MVDPDPASPDQHPFLTAPHRTILALCIPVMLSAVAEPVTGLVDTGFVSRLGSTPLAALGVGSAALSLAFWVFNFLSVSTQTEVAQALGDQNRQRAAQITGLALTLAVLFSLVLIAVFLPAVPWISTLLGAEDAVKADAETYLRIRLLGAPAVLLTWVVFGALRGLQDMRTVLLIAVGINAVNIVLDGPFISGWGPVPKMGVAGAALASVIAQWSGMVWGLRILYRRLGLVAHRRREDVRLLIKVGGDMFVRTGLLTVYLMLATRVANQIGADAGAAHQSLRTVLMFVAFVLDGFALTSQSLVGYFLGAARVTVARQVARLTIYWGLSTGIALTAGLLLATNLVAAAFVPDESVSLFKPAWVIVAFLQPVAGLAFITDGIHWGTSDFGYLRNGMLMAALIGGAALLAIDVHAANAFTGVWTATAMFISVRAVFGMIRVWPGIGQAPLRGMPVAVPVAGQD